MVMLKYSFIDFILALIAYSTINGRNFSGLCAIIQIFFSLTIADCDRVYVLKMHFVNTRHSSSR